MEKLFPGCDAPCEGYKTAIQLVEKAAQRVSADAEFDKAAHLKRLESLQADALRNIVADLTVQVSVLAGTFFTLKDSLGILREVASGERQVADDDTEALQWIKEQLDAEITTLDQIL